VTDRQGTPVALQLSVGQRHEAAEAVALLDQALERLRPEAVAGHRGYSAHPIRHEIEAVIPWRSTERGPKTYDINRLKRHRRIATRYDTLAASYLSWLTMACILEWL